MADYTIIDLEGLYDIDSGYSYSNHDIEGNFDIGGLVNHNIKGSYSIDSGYSYTQHNLLGNFNVMGWSSHNLNSKFTVINEGYTAAIGSPYYGSNVAGAINPIWFKVEIFKVSGGSKVLEDVKSIRLNFKMSSPLTWEIVLNNKYGKYSPYNAEYSGWLEPDIYSSGKLDKRMRITANVGGSTWVSPDLVLLSRRMSTTPDGYEVSLEGIDLMQLLLKNNQTLPGYLSTSSWIYTANAIMIAILDTAGITSRSVTVPDYPIYQFEIQGERLLDAINTLLFVSGGEYFMDCNNTFIIRTPQPRTSSPDWTYEDNVNIFSIGENSEVTDLINQVSFSKISANTKEENPDDLFFEFREPGWHDISLPRPYRLNYYSPIMYTKSWSMPGGMGYTYFTYILYYDKDDKLVAWHYGQEQPGIEIVEPDVDGNPISPVTKIRVYCDLTALPPLNDYTNVLYWGIRFAGTLVQDIPPAGLIAPSFNVLVKDLASIDKYGLWILDNTPELSLIPDEATAIAIATRLMNNSGRLRTTIDLEVPFNPFLKLGDTLKVVESATGINSYYYLEDFSHDISTSNLSTRITVTKYIR